ncbi:MAG: alpha/beta hydrolase [Deltaproteobacteria bacterium]|nr:alpha/beta hydrolase [Deltaproteobacteria bacterium]
MARPFEDSAPCLLRRATPAPGGREVLFIHGAWHGPWCWDGLWETAARAGHGVSLLELPGHGEEPWPLPPLTSLADYADLARRAAASLGRPVLVGHSLGGWLIQKILEVADLPAFLLAPVPGAGLPLLRLARLMAEFPAQVLPCLAGRPLVIATPAMQARLFHGRLPLAAVERLWPRLVPEPALAALELGLGLTRARPRPGREPRLVLAPGADYFIPAAAFAHLAGKLGARLTVLPDMPHNPWLEDPAGLVARQLAEFLAGQAAYA